MSGLRWGSPKEVMCVQFGGEDHGVDFWGSWVLCVPLSAGSKTGLPVLKLQARRKVGWEHDSSDGMGATLKESVLDMQSGPVT